MPSLSPHSRLCLLMPALLASACVAPKAPPPPPAPIPVPAVGLPPAPVTTDWRDIPLTGGDWRYGVEAGAPTARFGQPGVPPDLVARCDRAARTVTLLRTAAGMVPATSAVTMAITTSAGDRALAAAPAAGPLPGYAATLPAGDGFLDRMAFSRGRFIVAVAGTARLAIPSWPEFARLIEECRG